MIRFLVSAILAATTAHAAPNLPIVPWSGGQAYWAKIPAAKAAGWDDPGFFPVAVWFESVTAPADIEMDKAAGLNTYMMLTANSDMSLIRSAGMFAFPDHPLKDAGNETIGWMVVDEPDMTYGAGVHGWDGTDGAGHCTTFLGPGGKCGFTVMREKEAKLPKTGRAFYIGFGKWMMLAGPALGARWIADADTFGADAYWYTDPDLCLGSQGGQMLPATGPIDISGAHALTPAECHRASNYGAIVDRLRSFEAYAGTYKPIWSYVEVGFPAPKAGLRSLTGPKIQGAVMSALIHGAGGIIYFNHSFAGKCVSYHLLREPCGAANRPYVAEINKRIADLAPILNSPSYAWSFNPDLDTMLKAGEGAYYIFAQQHKGSSGSYTFALPPDLKTAKSASVLYEDRSVPVADAKFTDHFDAEYAWHIYKLSP